MTFKIGLVASQAFLDNLKSQDYVVNRSDCKIIYIPYKSLSEIINIYLNNSNKVDAFIFSGELASYLLMHNKVKLEKPIYNFTLTNEELYRLLLKIAIENPKIDFSRVFIDFISEENNYLGLKNIFPKDKFPYTEKFTIDDTVYEKALKVSEKLFNEGKIDIYITRLGNLEEVLKQKGIKTFYLSPSKENIINTYEKVINELKMKQFENNQIVIGNISIPGITNNYKNYNFELQLLDLHKVLIEFAQKHYITFSIERVGASFNLYISNGILKEYTNNYSNCLLLSYIKETLNFKINIGWGIGNAIEQAKRNALYANSESDKHKGNCSFIVTDENRVIGPLSEDNCLVYENLGNSYIENISKGMNISPINIQKILGLMKKLNTNELSATDTAYYLGISERSANRLLSKLVENGNASVTYKKSEKLRGRPQNIYLINFDFPVVLKPNKE